MFLNFYFISLTFSFLSNKKVLKVLYFLILATNSSKRQFTLLEKKDTLCVKAWFLSNKICYIYQTLKATPFEWERKNEDIFWRMFEYRYDISFLWTWQKHLTKYVIYICFSEQVWKQEKCVTFSYLFSYKKIVWHVNYM